MSVKRVDPAEAAELVAAGWSYVDVRSTEEFEAGHPAGAYNIPLMHRTARGMTPNPDFAAVVEGTFATDARLLVGCRSGARSLRAATQMVELGYGSVIDVRGGFDGERTPAGHVTVEGWAGRGLDVSTAAQPGRSYRELLAAAKGS